MDSIRPWFYLKSVPGIGNLLCKRLIDRFKSPENIFQASDEELMQINGLTGRHVLALKKHHLPDSIEAELALVARSDYHIVCLTDSNYPRLLREIPDPPIFLYVYGQLEGYPGQGLLHLF